MSVARMCWDIATAHNKAHPNLSFKERSRRQKTALEHYRAEALSSFSFGLPGKPPSLRGGRNLV